MTWRLSPDAAEDLAALAAWSIEQHGERQTDAYVSGLLEMFALLARFPGMGRDAGDGRRLRVYRQHRVIYRLGEDGAVIVLDISHNARAV